MSVILYRALSLTTLGQRIMIQTRHGCLRSPPNSNDLNAQLLNTQKAKSNPEKNNFYKNMSSGDCCY
ncbi:hypothetical protein FKM82_022248 [Ascaphus truei]